MNSRKTLLMLVGFIALSSGFCSLVYQVIWDRTVKYNFGGDSLSSAIVTGTFLLGLGLGAWLFGRWRSDAHRTYAAVELAIGLFGISSFFIISPLASTLAHWLNTGPEQLEGLRPVVVIGCILLLLPPCTLIGGTLPLMLKCFVKPLNFSARTLGLIYGINTFGASAGILAVPLLLLNHLSLPVTLTIVGSINILLAVVILYSRQTLIRAAGDTKVETNNQVNAPAPVFSLVTVLAFVSGFIAISFEISLFRALQIVNPSSAYNFPLVLVFFLFALALGSVIFTRTQNEGRDQLIRRIAWLLTGAACAMLLSIWIAAWLHGWWYPVSFLPILDTGSLDNLHWVLLFFFVLVVPVPFFTGAIFPLLLRVQCSNEENLPQTTGRLYLINSLGGFCGAIPGKFLGFGLIGTQSFLSLVFLITLLLGAGILIRQARKLQMPGYMPYASLACGLVLLLVMPGKIWTSYITGGPEENWEIKEGVTGVAQIWWEGEIGDVRVNGQYMSRLPNHPRHIKQEIFLLSVPKRKNVLVLGIGGAGLINTLVKDPEIEHIYAVDWSYELPDLLGQGRANVMLENALHAEKVTVLKADARVAVSLFEAGSFDLVYDNLAFASWAGSASIKSATYFKKIKNLLAPGGVYVKSANYFGENRLAVLAGLTDTFSSVREHGGGEVVLAAEFPKEYADDLLLTILQPRAESFEMDPENTDLLLAWFHKFTTINASMLGGIEPIRDDLLIYEYSWRPFVRNSGI